MNETLMVRCKTCGREYPAPHQFDRATLESLVLNERYGCPHCGREAIYVKSDHYFVLITRRRKPPG